LHQLGRIVTDKLREASWLRAFIPPAHSLCNGLAHHGVAAMHCEVGDSARRARVEAEGRRTAEHPYSAARKPEQTYQQGLRQGGKSWSRTDFLSPIFCQTAFGRVLQ
jgi:hypothetical protein